MPKLSADIPTLKTWKWNELKGKGKYIYIYTGKGTDQKRLTGIEIKKVASERQNEWRSIIRKRSGLKKEVSENKRDS